MQTYAFVLDSSEKGEYDRTYSLLTKDLGIVDAFAKSVRKSRSKLSGHLEPPNFCWVELVESQRGWQITSALEEDPHRAILASPAALRTVLQAGWLLRALIPVSHPDEAVWNLWEAFVRQLSRSSRASPATQRGVLAQFLAKLLAHLGFFPAPTDVTPPGRLRENLIAVLEGAWLPERDTRDPALWEVVKAAVKTAQRLMR
jgi:recombinational DNA repair protein (RecF pathway)